MARPVRRFTIYDKLEADGVFAENTANSYSAEYIRQDYPKMFYHPTGETFVAVAGHTEITPWGPRIVGEIKEIISKVAENATEAATLIAAGWHDHPAKAIAASGGKAPPMTSEHRVNDLEAQLKELQRQLDAAKSGLSEQANDDEASKPLPRGGDPTFAPTKSK
jgi:hypothetical protein